MPEPARQYPGMPAYGAPQPAAPRVTSRTPAPHGAWVCVGLAVLFNLVTLVGVLAFGWPAGNVFVLFWVENVVLGLVTAVRVATARGAASLDVRSRMRFTDANDHEISPPTSHGGSVAFFVFHYGLFCFVHLVFTVVVAIAFGFDGSWWFLGLPVTLLVLRYAVELATTWFGSDGLRETTSSRQAMLQPYPRIVVLQVGVIVGFALALTTWVTSLPGGPPAFDQIRHALDLVARVVPAGSQAPAVLAVLVLLLVKTVVDVVTTRRALQPRPR